MAQDGHKFLILLPLTPSAIITMCATTASSLSTFYMVTYTMKKLVLMLITTIILYLFFFFGGMGWNSGCFLFLLAGKML
jgi:hypothetical protein